jgi:hypothetical protein
MAPVRGDDAMARPVTVLWSEIERHVGPAKCVATGVPHPSYSVASGVGDPQPYFVPPSGSFEAPHA